MNAVAKTENRSGMLLVIREVIKENKGVSLVIAVAVV